MDNIYNYYCKKLNEDNQSLMTRFWKAEKIFKKNRFYWQLIVSSAEWFDSQECYYRQWWWYDDDVDLERFFGNCRKKAGFFVGIVISIGSYNYRNNI